MRAFLFSVNVFKTEPVPIYYGWSCVPLPRVQMLRPYPSTACKEVVTLNEFIRWGPDLTKVSL